MLFSQEWNKNVRFYKLVLKNIRGAGPSYDPLLLLISYGTKQNLPLRIDARLNEHYNAQYLDICA